jgi:hypothetical protein
VGSVSSACDSRSRLSKRVVVRRFASHVTAHQPFPPLHHTDPQQAAGFHFWQSFYITRYRRRPASRERAATATNKSSAIARSPVPQMLPSTHYIHLPNYPTWHLAVHPLGTLGDRSLVPVAGLFLDPRPPLLGLRLDARTPLQGQGRQLAHLSAHCPPTGSCTGRGPPVTARQHHTSRPQPLTTTQQQSFPSIHHHQR